MFDKNRIKNQNVEEIRIRNLAIAFWHWGSIVAHRQHRVDKDVLPHNRPHKGNKHCHLNSMYGSAWCSATTLVHPILSVVAFIFKKHMFEPQCHCAQIQHRGTKTQTLISQYFVVFATCMLCLWLINHYMMLVWWCILIKSIVNTFMRSSSCTCHGITCRDG